MEKYFAVWVIAWGVVTFGVMGYMHKKKRKYNLDKITLIAGLILAAALFVILYFAMKIQISDLLQTKM